MARQTLTETLPEISRGALLGHGTISTEIVDLIALIVLHETTGAEIEQRIKTTGGVLARFMGNGGKQIGGAKQASGTYQRKSVGRETGSATTNSGGMTDTMTRPGRPPMSESARKRIAAAQRKRWKVARANKQTVGA